MIKPAARKKFQKLKWLFMTFLFMLLVSGCASPEPLNLSVTLFAACEGKGSNGRPIAVSEVFPVSGKPIFACGRIESNHLPLFLTLRWRREGRLIQRDVIRVEGEYFYSRLPSERGHYQPGEYSMSLYAGKSFMFETTFQVEE